VKPVTVLSALTVLAASALFVTAGFWQLSRLHAKRLLNAAQRAQLASAPVLLAVAPEPYAQLAGHRVLARGTYDEAHHVLLSSRFRHEAPGVELVTPLRLSSGAAVLVDRGWLAADDQLTAEPSRFPEPGPREVSGVLVPLARTAGPPWRRLAGPGTEVWSTHDLDLPNASSHLPYQVAPYVLHALPEPGAPAPPMRDPPPPFDEATHLSYAIQWFAFAGITLVGSLAYALRRGARAPAAGAPGA
jgi:surfeit locus 1 family protein